MLRLALVAVLTTLASPAAAQITGTLPPANAAAGPLTGVPVPATPALRREVSVASDLVRIGDLIDNAGASARIPIFRAPDPGQTGTVSAAAVVAAVRAHGFTVVETAGISEVAVTHLSRRIPVKDIEARIANAFAGQSGLGEAKNLVVTIERDARPVNLDPTLTGDLQVTRQYYDPRSGRFDVTFEIAGGAPSARHAQLRYAGTVVETTETVLLGRPLNRGEVVKASDVTIERRPKAEVAADAVSATGGAVGLAARRPLRGGEALRASDLMKPEFVQRNESVTLVFESPGLLLTLRGKALESGAEGDTINVLNIQSKRTVQGTVSAPGQVTIAMQRPRLTAEADTSPASQPAGDPSR